MSAPTLPTLGALQAALDEAIPACGSFEDLLPWTVCVRAIYTDPWGCRTSDSLEWPPGLDGEQYWWAETWDGTIAQLERMLAEAQEPVRLHVGAPKTSIAGTVIEPGGMGYAALVFEREWHDGNWGDTAVEMAVFPAICVRETKWERLDPDSPGLTDVGYRKFLAKLDAAHAQAVL